MSHKRGTVLKDLDCRVCHTKNLKSYEGVPTQIKSFCREHYLENCKKTSKLRSENLSEEERLSRNSKSKKYYYNNILLQRIKNARLRARDKNLEFDLQVVDLERLLKQQENKCIYTSIEFDISNPDLTVSLDRRDSSLGYTIDNVQLVLGMVNYMKQDLDEKEFFKLCGLVYKNSI